MEPDNTTNHGEVGPFGMTDTMWNALVEQREAMNARLDLVSNAQSLPDEAWEAIDRNIIELARARTPLYSDLVDAVGVTDLALEDEEYSYFNSDGEMKGKETRDFTREALHGRVGVNKFTVPVPVYSADYSIGRREMGRLNRNGGNLESTHQNTAVYAVSTMLENLVLNGPAMTVNGTPARGLSNHDAVIDVTGDVVTGGIATFTGDQWKSFLTKTLSAIEDQNMPIDNLTMYIKPGDWLHATLSKYSNTDPQLIADYVRSAGDIREVVTVPTIPANTVYFVDKRTDYIRIPVARALAARPLGRVDEMDPYGFTAEAVTGLAIVQNGNGKTAIAKSVSPTA